MAINPSYQFIQHIAQEFDKKNFPETGFNSLKPELLKIGLQQSGTNELPELPEQVYSSILQHSVKNTHDFLFATGQLGTQKAVVDTGTINDLALTILKKLELPRNANTSPRKQLCNYMYQEVFIKANIEEKHQIIRLATEANSEVMDTTSQEIRVYRIKRAVGNFFNNKIVKLSVGVSAWYIANHLATRTIQIVKVTYIPSLVNRFINIAPLFVIRGMNRVIGCVEAVYARRFKIFLASLAIRFTVGQRSPFLNRISQGVANVICLPYTISQNIRWLPWNVAWKFGTLSYMTQARISQSLATVSDEKLQRELDLGGQKAYALWMDLMERAQQQGICRLLASEQA